MCHSRLHPSQEIREGTDREADRQKLRLGETQPEDGSSKVEPFPSVFQQQQQQKVIQHVKAWVSTKHSFAHQHMQQFVIAC